MLRVGYDLSANFASSSLSTKMDTCSECFSVLRQLVRLLSQSDDSYETEFVCLRKKCEEKVFQEKFQVKTPSSNEKLSVYASSPICKYPRAKSCGLLNAAAQ